MQFLNISVSVLKEIEFSKATHEQQAIWLSLICYCVEKENGGTITTAGSWDDKHCLRVIGCAKDQLTQPSPLWHYSAAGSIDVAHYPTKAEQLVRLNRATQQAAARSRSPDKQAAARQNGQKGGRPRTIIPMIQQQNEGA